MNLRLTAIFAYADIGAVSSGFTVNNAMSNLSLLRRRCIFVQIFWVKTMKYIPVQLVYPWISPASLSKGLVMPRTVLLLK